MEVLTFPGSALDIEAGQARQRPWRFAT